MQKFKLAVVLLCLAAVGVQAQEIGSAWNGPSGQGAMYYYNATGGVTVQRVVFGKDMTTISNLTVGGTFAAPSGGGVTKALGYFATNVVIERGTDGDSLTIQRGTDGDTLTIQRPAQFTPTITPTIQRGTDGDTLTVQRPAAFTPTLTPTIQRGTDGDSLTVERPSAVTPTITLTPLSDDFVITVTPLYDSVGITNVEASAKVYAVTGITVAVKAGWTNATAASSALPAFATNVLITSGGLAVTNFTVASDALPVFATNVLITSGGLAATNVTITSGELSITNVTTTYRAAVTNF